ncbi:MAG: hypothetical protein RL648_678 [Verrucomicrobiota bacterium]
MSVSSPSPSPVFEAITEPLRFAFDELEAFLEEQVRFFEPEVRSLVRYCFGHSGKKLRPLLVFSAAGGGVAARKAEITKAAAIVELVHLATLVHDDILDEATVRHRTETVAARHGSHIAVLLGDALFSHALHLASGFDSVEVCRVVSKATRQVCSGEIVQTFSRQAAIPDRHGYFRIIDLKTAELFRVSTYLGGLLTQLDTEQLEALVNYATHLGRAYQIYDDMADIFGREAQAGKTLGTDLATGKATLPVILWLEGLPEADRPRAVSGIWETVGSTDFTAVLADAGIPGRVHALFLAEILAARGHLAALAARPADDPLERLLHFLEAAWNKFSVT